MLRVPFQVFSSNIIHFRESLHSYTHPIHIQKFDFLIFSKPLMCKESTMPSECKLLVYTYLRAHFQGSLFSSHQYSASLQRLHECLLDVLHALLPRLLWSAAQSQGDCHSIHTAGQWGGTDCGGMSREKRIHAVEQALGRKSEDLYSGLKLVL